MGKVVHALYWIAGRWVHACRPDNIQAGLVLPKSADKITCVKCQAIIVQHALERPPPAQERG